MYVYTYISTFLKSDQRRILLCQQSGSLGW